MARLNELIRSQGVPQGKGSSPPPKGEPSAVSFKKMEENVTQVSAEQQAQLALEADQWLGRAETELTAIVIAVRRSQAFLLTGITQIVNGFVDSLAHGDRLLVKAVSGGRGGLVISNLINTAIIAIKVGMGLRYSREDLMRLGLAAILHDVGMCLISEDIVNKQGPLNPEEWNSVERHPELGAQAIRRLGAEAEWIAELVLQEHERFEGQGYPRRLKGAEIHEYAQIIGLTDTFEALLHVRPYRERLLPHEAIRELVTKEKGAFSTRVLKSLIQQFSVFPLGTRVRLNSGEAAEVVELNQKYPLRPIVKVYLDSGQVALSQPRMLDLSKTSLVHITEVVHDDRQT
jgi:response regulator RpfG family c-di-GMP phosphodiesterase